MYNPNQNPTEEDRVLTPKEAQAMNLSHQIQLLKDCGYENLTNAEIQLKNLETQGLIERWLNSFTDDVERAEAVELAMREGIPPEVFTTPEHIHEGPLTQQ